MAHKHRRHRRHHHRRHRRMGAMSLSGFPARLVAAGAGFFLGDTVNGLIQKVIPTSVVPAPPAAGTSMSLATFFNTNTVPIFITGGAAAALLLRRNKTTATLLIGSFAAGLALQQALKNMGVVTGYQSVPVIGRRRMGGYQSVPVIGAKGMPMQLSGVPPQLTGFNVNGYRPVGSNVMGRVNGLYTGTGVYGVNAAAACGCVN